MKTLITAIGIDQINELFSRQPNVNVLDIDIQTQEELWIKFRDESIVGADYLVIIDTLKGPFSKQELIEEVRKQFGGKIYVILREPEDELFIKVLRGLKITNVFSIDDNIQELIETLVYDGVELAEPVAPEEVVAELTTTPNRIVVQKQVVSVVGPGGSGKTTVVLDLANELTAQGYNVCVVDLNLEKGDVASYTGAEELGFQELIRQDATEKNILECVTIRKKISYFSGLKNLMDAQSAQGLSKIVIKVLKKHFDVLVLDTGSFINPNTHTALIASDNVVFVLRNAETHIKATRRYLDLYNVQIGMPLRAVAVVNAAMPSDLGSEEIASILEIPVVSYIKFDPKVFSKVEKGDFMKSPETLKLKDSLFKLDRLLPEKKPWFKFMGRR